MDEVQLPNFYSNVYKGFIWLVQVAVVSPVFSYIIFALKINSKLPTGM